ncbi:MAG TPA: hypothetical protein VK476_04950 [Flavobacterium sp.]|nr:hypothetical protein [Flavobacterium sp.]
MKKTILTLAAITVTMLASAQENPGNKEGGATETPGTKPQPSSSQIQTETSLQGGSSVKAPLTDAERKKQDMAKKIAADKAKAEGRELSEEAKAAVVKQAIEPQAIAPKTVPSKAKVKAKVKAAKAAPKKK